MSLLKRIKENKTTEQNKNVLDMTQEELRHELKYPHMDNLQEMEEKFVEHIQQVKEHKREEGHNKKYRVNDKGLKVVETPMTFKEIKKFTN